MIDVHLAPGLRQHRAGEVRHGDAQMPVAEVDPEREAGGAVQRDHHRRAAGVGLARVGAVLALGCQPGLEQVSDDGRDRRAGEAGEPGELGATRGAALAERVDESQLAVPRAER